jgi:molybdopterin biosynthesis enzyme
LNACVRVEDVEMVYANELDNAFKAKTEKRGSGWFVPGLRATHIRIRRPVTTGQHVRRAGEDISAGIVLLASNAFVKPEHVLALANAGIQHIYVLRKVRIAVLHTGSELRQTYTPPVADDTKANGSSTATPEHNASIPLVFPPRACIPDSNGPFLRAALERSFGAAISVTLMGCLPDQLDATCAGLRRALRGEQNGATNAEAAGSLLPHPNRRFDVLLTTGGVSVGRHDLVPAALHAVGCRQLFHGVAVKPGHPLLVAVWEGDNQLEDKNDTQAHSEAVPAASLHAPHSSTVRPSPVVCFGLPGNPVAAGVGVRFFVHSWLRTLWRQQEEQPMMARLYLVSELDGSVPAVHHKTTIPPTLRLPPPGSITFLKAQLCARPPATGRKQDAVDPSSLWVRPACASLQQASRCAPMLMERFVWIQLTCALPDVPVSAHSSSSSSSANRSTGLPPSSAAVLSDGALVEAWPVHAGCIEP